MQRNEMKDVVISSKSEPIVQLKMAMKRTIQHDKNLCGYVFANGIYCHVMNDCIYILQYAMPASVYPYIDAIRIICSHARIMHFLAFCRITRFSKRKLCFVSVQRNRNEIHAFTWLTMDHCYLHSCYVYNSSAFPHMIENLFSFIARIQLFII